MAVMVRSDSRAKLTWGCPRTMWLEIG
jgi:hypothetical protein